MNAEKDGNCFVLAHVYDTISPSYKVLMKLTGNLKETNTDTLTMKPYKVFISHSSKDKEFVEALVEMLESIGFDPSTLFYPYFICLFVFLQQFIKSLICM